MVLAALVVSQFPRRSWERPEQQTRPSPRFKLLRAASIGEAALIFSTAPAPRGEQAKAADSLPKRDRKAAHRAVSVTTKEVEVLTKCKKLRLRASTAERNGAALCSLASSAMPNSGKTPGGFPFPAGRHFFSRSIPMRQDDRSFWQEVREELSPRRNPIGWACVLAILGMFCLVGYFDHPAELHMRPAIIVSK